MMLSGCTPAVNTEAAGTPVAIHNCRTASVWFAVLRLEQGSVSVWKFSCRPPYRSPMFGARMARWNWPRNATDSLTRQSRPYRYVDDPANAIEVVVRTAVATIEAEVLGEEQIGQDRHAHFGEELFRRHIARRGQAGIETDHVARAQIFIRDVLRLGRAPLERRPRS